MTLPSVPATAIVAAMDEFDAQLRSGPEWQNWEANGNYEHAIVRDGKHYPVKQIVSMATGTPKTEFGGGPEANTYVQKLGFAVEPISEQKSTADRQIFSAFAAALEGIMSAYPTARRTDEFSASHPLFQTALTAKQLVDSSSVLGRRPHLISRVSFGRGNWASVPWLAIMDERETTTTRRGIYCVYLFREDGSGVYLTLNQGVTEPRQRLGGVAARASLRSVARDIRPLIGRLETAGFNLDENVDLRSSSSLGEDYQVSTIAHKLYSAGEVPADGRLSEDLEVLVATYESVLDSRRTQPTRIELSEVHELFAAAVAKAGLRFGSSHDTFVRAFVASLITKPLVILTGLSGSGKTQLALKFGEWLGEDHSMVVPVRPDWTGPEALFGYVDALKPTSPDGRASWFVPDTLDFILTAARDPARPYLLVLDEMNLAHVERYFADFLSGVESRTPILPNLTRDAGEWRVDPEDSTKLVIPRNLFVVGTVNVDETTYMFSPKVLDRANTMEFRVQTADLPESPRVPGKLPPGSGSALNAFLQAALDDEFHKKRPAIGQAEFAGQLRALHAVLSRHGAEFGYRSFYEALRFASVYAALGDESWQQALDLQVMQKVLPRLHGGRRKLEPLLSTLGLYCFRLTTDGSESFDPLAPGDGSPKLAISFDKVQRMTSNVRANQFVSFSE
jgi:5-methylcytosine-specific restriction enzyme B